MRIIINRVTDIPYECFLFTGAEQEINGEKKCFLVAQSILNPEMSIAIKEVQPDKLADELMTISSAYCNGAKRLLLG